MFDDIKQVELPQNLKSFLGSEVELIFGTIIGHENEVETKITATTGYGPYAPTDINSKTQKAEVFWVKTIDGNERQFKLYGSINSFRDGHFIVLLVRNKNEILGYYNQNTKQYICNVIDKYVNIGCIVPLFLTFVAFLAISMACSIIYSFFTKGLVTFDLLGITILLIVSILVSFFILRYFWKSISRFVAITRYYIEVTSKFFPYISKLLSEANLQSEE